MVTKLLRSSPWLFGVSAAVIASATFAQSSPDLDGTWAWEVGGRTAFVVKISCMAADGPTGSFERPKHFTLESSAGTAVMRNVVGPAEKLSFEALECDASEVRFKVLDGEPGESPTEFYLGDRRGDAASFGLSQLRSVLNLELKAVDAGTAVEPDWDAAAVYGTAHQYPDNPDLKRLFDEDQAARQGGRPLGPEVEAADQERRQQVRVMLDQGQVRSGADYFHSAFIFQHGSKSDDYLLAHALATAALSKGYDGAVWIATATLDRYLQSIGQPQIYGTQYILPRDGAPTQGSYNQNLLTDGVRMDSNVPSLADQVRQLERYGEAMTKPDQD